MLSDENKFDFQIAKTMENYVPSGCESVPICAKGEWYQPSLGENEYIYNNRYMLSNAAKNDNYHTGLIIPSSDNYDVYILAVYLSGGGWDGGVQASVYKEQSHKYFPMLSFYVR